MTRQRGFSLVELAVVLLIAGLIAVAVVRTLPLLLSPGDGADSRPFQDAADAVAGFAMAEARLPCPDASGDGREECNGDAIGRLPWRTLGIDRPPGALEYAAAPGLTDPPAGQRHRTAAPVGAQSNAVNGLDTCADIITQLRDRDGVAVGAHGDTFTVAYALARPPANHVPPAAGGAAYFLDGSDPGVHRSRTHLVGPAGLSAQLDCPRRLAASHVGGRDVAVQTDLLALKRQLTAFRDNALAVRRANQDNLDASQELVAGEMAITAVKTPLSVAEIMLGRPAGAAGAKLAASEAAGIAMAAIRLALGTAETVTRAGLILPGLAEAQTDLDDIQAALDFTEQYLDRQEDQGRAHRERGIVQ